MNDMTGVIRKFYAHASMPLSDEAMRRMRQWAATNSQHKQGVHRHTLEEAGLTAELVREKFRPCIERFGHLF